MGSGGDVWEGGQYGEVVAAHVRPCGDGGIAECRVTQEKIQDRRRSGLGVVTGGKSWRREKDEMR